MIIILGDTHGEWGKLFDKLKRTNITNSTIIHVGDMGIGYRHDLDENIELLERINDILAQDNNTILGIRGNHDNPNFFNGDYVYSNLKLLPDYTTMDLDGEKFMFIGGATSIDRTLNIENKTWWKDEVLVLDEAKLEGQFCDVLITHTAPSWIGPTGQGPIKWFLDKDPTLWDELVVERQKMNRIIEILKPKTHYCGHFHMNCTVKNDTIHSRILNIHEMLEHNKNS